jgi:arylsulfatase A
VYCRAPINYCKSIFRRLIVIRLILATCLLPLAVLAADKPNIVFILADDMSFDSVSANNPKMGPLKTPHIDTLIAQGMNFADAHSGSAVCTPTRYGLLTGRYCWRTKLKKEVLWDWAAPLVESDRLTVAELLKEQGYATGMIGKWHLGLTWYDKDKQPVNHELQLRDATWRPGAGAERLAEVEKRIDFTKATSGGPNDHGFDYWFGVDVPNFAPYCWMENGKTLGIPTVPKPKAMFGSKGPMLPGWKLEDILVGLGDRAAAWIREQSKADSPFFLYLPLTSPHTPIAPSAKFQGKSGISPYADFVMETDAVVGQVMKALADSGQADNTLLIFSTDNGTSGQARFPVLEKHGVNLRYHFKGHKAQIHEGGHRVPFVARWPARIKPGSSCSQVIGLNDFMATVADILDVELPDNAAEDSVSILPLLTSESTSLPDRPLVVNHDYGGSFAIRHGKWKLVERGRQLFNLEDDPKEASNVAKAHPEVVQNLLATLDRYRKSGRSRVPPGKS